MKITYTVHTRIHIPKTDLERHQARLKRKHGCRALLRALEAQAGQSAHAGPEPGRTAASTLPQTGAQS